MNDKVLIRVNRFNTLSNEYTFPLTHAFRLNYEVDFGPFLVRIIYVVFELIHLIWKEPCLWEEFIVPWKLPLHFLEITCQIVFASYLEHSWKVIDSLVRFYLLEHLKGWGDICPRDVPLSSWNPGVLLTYYPPAEDFFAYLLDHIILSVERIKCYPHWFSIFSLRDRRLIISTDTILSVSCLLFRRLNFSICSNN